MIACKKMKKIFPYFVTLSIVLIVIACKTNRKISIQNEAAESLAVAFPGAEGFGKYTTGGRGGKVIIVSNLNDAGPGSLRDAVDEKLPRIIVFSLSGTVHLLSPLNIRGDVTIAGQTAPGDGICVADHPVVVKGDNVIIRYIRFRMGDKNQNKGMVHGSGHDDAFSANRIKHLIVDHCSMSWSTDEVCSVYNGDSTTLQWNIISEPLNYSYHFETGDTDFERHGFGGIVGGLHTTFHHNLYAHCVSRTPRFNGIRHTPTEFVDFRNNVIYNWGGNNVYGGEGGKYNIINNYYKYGPSTSRSSKENIANPYSELPKLPFGQWHVDGNYSDGSPSVTTDNWLGVKMNKGNNEDAIKAKATSPFPAENINIETALDAYTSVLNNAGASLQRDTLDQRIINNVKNRTGSIIDVQGGFAHGTPYNLTVNAWPFLKPASPLADTDKDGMPDAWERKNKLNEKDGSDASASTLHKHYTNIEVYVNSLIIK